MNESSPYTTVAVEQYSGIYGCDAVLTMDFSRGNTDRRDRFVAWDETRSRILTPKRDTIPCLGIKAEAEMSQVRSGGSSFSG
jgi:hypothetical protein